MSIGRFFAVISLVCLLVPSGVSAQQTAAPATQVTSGFPIMVINLEFIRRESLAVKGIRQEIEKFRKTFQGGIEKEEKALRAANQELQKKRSILAPEAFAKERRQFEQRVVGVQKLVQKRKRQLDQTRLDAMRQVEKRLNAIILDSAQKRNALLVLRRSHTLIVAKGIDGTNEVLTRLNKELPKVPVKKPTD